jgi:methionyl-tRNA synthetase
MERTVVLVKPDAYERGLLAEITRRFEASALTLAGAKMLVPSRKMARAHYALALPDADDESDAAAAAAEQALDVKASFLCSGPVVALAWEGERAVATALALAGASDPRAATPGTVRGDLASAPDRNLIEASPDAATAARELALWFKAGELGAELPVAHALAPAPPHTAAGTPGARLPQPGARNVLVTSALPYVNNVPHLGNIIGCVLSADVYARYLRQRDVNVIYMCGTDEYGTATEIKAIAEGLSPQEICDKYHAIHADVYAWFDIEFDHFGRTSTPYQTEICQSVFWDVHANGCLVQKTTQQLYSEPLGKFLADRYVQGQCPHCGYDDARGDQCDACGKLLNPTELVNPRCVATGATPVVRATEHLYLDLPKLTAPLEEWIETASVDGFWTHNSLTTTQAWLKMGLQPRCITRDLKWGVPVPLAGWEHKVFYVWFDAPIGYISITANYCGEGWRQWWQPAAGTDVKLVQFMGKDNIPFHTVIFPATLIASGKPWLKLHHISTTEYLNYEEGKFSKSRGTGVFGDSAKDTGIPVSVFRYYLLANRPEISDSAFRWDDLAAKNNNELLANLGNFVNRATTFTKSKFGDVVPTAHGLDGAPERKLIADVDESLKAYHASLESVSIREGLRHAMTISRLGNVYLQESAPWKSIKTDPRAAETCCAVALNLCRLLAVIFEPYMGCARAARPLHARARARGREEGNPAPPAHARPPVASIYTGAALLAHGAASC